MSWKPEQVLVHGRECFNWENSREHCTCICYRIDLKQRSFCVGFKYPRPTGNFQVWPAGVFTVKVPRKQDGKSQNSFALYKFQLLLGISDIGRESKFIGGNQDVAWILGTQKTQLLLPYWDGGAPFSVKRLPVYQRWHLIALHSPSLPLAKLSKTRQHVDQKWWWAQWWSSMSGIVRFRVAVYSGLI